MVEGIVSDIRRGYIVNFFKERGGHAEWKYNRSGFIRKAVVRVVIVSAIVALFIRVVKNHADKN
jgi:hypothetical protein